MSLLPKPSWASNDEWVNHGEKDAPVQTLPDDRIVGSVHKRKDTTPESIIGRLGVIGVMNYGAPSQYQHGFHHANNLRGGVANPGNGQAHLMTRTEVRNLASQYPIYPIEGNDFGESDFAFQPDSQQALWWYQRRREMYADVGINPNRVKRRDYGHHGCTISYQGTNGPWMNAQGGHISPTDPFFRKRYASINAARDGIGYFNTGIDGIAYQDLVGCNIKHYAETYDYARNYYSKRDAIQVMGKGMGKVGGIGPGFLVYNDWSKIEGIGGLPMASVNGGHYQWRRLENPKGWVKALAHPQVDYEWEVGCYLINGLLYSDGITTFDIPVRYGSDPTKMAALNGPGNDNVITVEWIPDVAGTPAPVSDDGFPVEPCRWHDAAMEAAHYYAQFDRTAGIPWSACAWRFAGSEQWIEPETDGADVLVAAAAFDGVNAVGQDVRRGRPTVDARVKNSAFDFVAFDPSRSKYYRETILVRAPNGQQFQTTLQGCKANSHTETLSL